MLISETISPRGCDTTCQPRKIAWETSLTTIQSNVAKENVERTLDACVTVMRSLDKLWPSFQLRQRKLQKRNTLRQKTELQSGASYMISDVKNISVIFNQEVCPSKRTRSELAFFQPRKAAASEPAAGLRVS